MEKIPAFVALDLETTGLDFEKDEIIEVALVRFENGEPKENLDFLVKPSAAELRPFIETLTGISKTDLEESPDFATVAGQICSFIGDLPVVAHNALFDSKFSLLPADSPAQLAVCMRQCGTSVSVITCFNHSCGVE